MKWAYGFHSARTMTPAAACDLIRQQAKTALSRAKEIRPYVHPVGHCQRCHAEVEPLLMEQWYLRVEPLARPAMDAVREGRMRFVPKRFERQALLISTTPLLLVRGTLQVEQGVVNIRGEEFRGLKAEVGAEYAQRHDFH